MTPVHDVQLHMAARMNAALASEDPSAALLCFIEDLEEFGLLGDVAKAAGLTPHSSPASEVHHSLQSLLYGKRLGFGSRSKLHQQEKVDTSVNKVADALACQGWRPSIVNNRCQK
jgi:hypothetical protein